MQKLKQIYEGKAKKVYGTDDPELYIVDYKDDATAFNGLKKGTIAGKGVINNRMSNLLMQMLEKNGIPTHFVPGAERAGDPWSKRCPSSLWRSSSATSPPAPSPSGTVSRRGWCLTSPFSSSPIKTTRWGILCSTPATRWP